MARANGLQALDGPFLSVEPDRRFLAAAHRARDLGFDGKWAIHPSQVEFLDEIFVPSAEDIEHARTVLAAFFEHLAVGRVSGEAPSLTLTSGHAAIHQSGPRRPPAAASRPGVVCDVAIGQSTLMTRRVIGNLFYRGRPGADQGGDRQVLGARRRGLGRVHGTKGSRSPKRSSGPPSSLRCRRRRPGPGLAAGRRPDDGRVR